MTKLWLQGPGQRHALLTTSSDLLKVSIVFPESPQHSEASGGSDYGHTPLTPAFGASGGWGSCPRPSRRQRMVAMPLMN